LGGGVIRGKVAALRRTIEPGERVRARSIVVIKRCSRAARKRSPIIMPSPDAVSVPRRSS